MKKQVMSACWVLLAFSLSYGQASQGENVSFLGLGRNGLGPPWTADTVWLGGVFLRDTTKPLIVVFEGGRTGVSGMLSVMNPVSDTAIPLFTNQVLVNTSANLSYLKFHNLDTVVFSYPSAGPPYNSISQIEYSGPNRRKGDPQNFKAFDRFSSDRYETGLVPGKTFAPLRRFFAAGWATDFATGQRLDRVEFGVEDWSDFNFSDCMFWVSGVWLNKPSIANSIVLTSDPPIATIKAGDNISIFATVMIDSAQTGKIKPSPQLSARAVWKLTGNPQGGSLRNDSLTPGSSDVFVGTRAYTTYTVTASYKDSLISMQASIQITVQPGPAYAVYVERDSVPDKWTPDTFPVVFLPYNIDTARAYAFERDQYQNLIGPATDPRWASLDPQKISVSSDSVELWKGFIAKAHLGLQEDSVLITVHEKPLIPDTVLAVAEYRIVTAPPVPDTPPGAYKGSITVTLTSATQGAAIWYCVNCETVVPGDTVHALLYSAGNPIRLSGEGTKTVRAIAVKSDPRYLPSPVFAGVYGNLDATGPAIVRVLYYSGTLADPSARAGNDTLIVYFSEPVPCSLLVDPRPPVSVFAYYDKDLIENAATVFTDARFPVLCRADSVMSISIILPPPGRKISPLEDSLRLGSGAVTDLYGNPSPANAPKVQIQWGRDYGLWVIAGPNPFRPATENVPSFLRDLLAGGSPPIPPRAASIQIGSVKTIDIVNSYAAVFDAVGNTIQDRLPVIGGKDKRTYFVFWDGANKGGRFVAAGSYLAIVHLKEASGAALSPIRRKIGISR